MLKILIIRLSSFGDVIHAMPAITDLDEQNIIVDWLVDEQFNEVARLHPKINRVIVWPLRRWKSAPYKVFTEFKFYLQQLRKDSYDIVIDIQGLIKSAILSRLARSKIYCGYDYNSAREKYASYFYTKKITINQNQHAITRVRELISKALNYNFIPSNLNYGLEKINSLESNNLVLFPGTSWVSKKWPIAHWKKLIGYTADKFEEIYIFSGNSSEYNEAQQIATSAANTKIMHNASIPTIVKTINSAKAVVTGDTGLGHLAAAYNIPLIALFGSTNAALTAPQAIKSKILTNNVNLPCQPCLSKKCKLSNVNSICMEQILPEHVWDSIQSII